MVKFLINRPVAVFMTSFAILLLGVVASLRIPTSLMPDIKIPEITVQLNYPNNTARELETNIVGPLRNRLLQVNNLKNIETETRDGFATLKLFFDYGINTDYAFIETNEKIDASLNYLPKDLSRPKVIKASATDVPIIYLTVSLKDNYSDELFLQLSEFSETVLKKRIEQIPEIALADLNGQTQAEITVSPNRLKLQSLGIENNILIDAIKQNNFEFSNLFVKNGIYQYNFKYINPLTTKEDIESIYLNINGRLFQIKDLATVTLVAQQEKGKVFLNSKRAIIFAIIKQADARVYDLKKELNNLTESFSNDYPNLEFATNQDQSQILKLSISNLKSSLLIGSFLAILIMFFFLKDIKSPLIIAISIPVSLIISILMLYIFGLSINIISLSGLILGVGMMIDNSIIVIDSISQKIDSGSSIYDSCVLGTNEVIAPLISSVLTTCSVFLPLIFLSGITGALFYDQAIAVSVGLIVSLIVSITLIPVIYSRFKNKKFRIEDWMKINVKSQNIESWYKTGYDFFFLRKWIVYTIAIISMFLGVLLFQTMEYSLLPKINQSETIAIIDWNDNISLEENQHRINLVLKDISNIDFHFSQIGEQQYLLQRENSKSFSEASVFLKTKTNKQLEDIKTSLKFKINKIFPDANLVFEDPKTIFQFIFGKNNNEIFAHIYSNNTSEVPSEKKLEKINFLAGNNLSSEIPLKKSISIQVNEENVLLYDVSYNELINELKATFNQKFIDNLKTEKKFIPIILKYDDIEFEDAIQEIYVKNNRGKSIPLKYLIKFNNIELYKTIRANKSGEFLEYKLNSQKPHVETISELENKFKKDNEFNIRFKGGILGQEKIYTELIWVIIVAIFLLYFIMAIQFESFWQPLIIISEIPIDIGGALFLLWLFGGTINIMSAIGFVVMSGVIINDSILKIHTINLLRKQGLEINEAIIQGGKLRLKPILMTSLTTILALTPFLFITGLGAELQRPLALTVIGGMILGTFISLYFVPIMYYKFSKKAN